MKQFEKNYGEFLCSTDKSLLNIKFVHNYLKNSYWAKDRPLESVQISIDNSLCFGVYHQKKQIGFARVVSDFSIFAYLADVFIQENFQSQGLGKWLIATICEHPQLKRINRFILATKDAHGLYAQFGFKPIKDPKLYMVKVS